MTHIKNDYYDATTEFQTDGYWQHLDVIAAHAAQPHGHKAKDYLILTPEGVYHAWGVSPSNIFGKSFAGLDKALIATITVKVRILQPQESLFELFDIH